MHLQIPLHYAYKHLLGTQGALSLKLFVYVRSSPLRTHGDRGGRGKEVCSIAPAFLFSTTCCYVAEILPRPRTAKVSPVYARMWEGGHNLGGMLARKQSGHAVEEAGRTDRQLDTTR